MKIILITCRVDNIEAYQEKRDAIDQRWITLMMACGYLPLIIPNSVAWLDDYLKLNKVDGVILTGGNDLANYGGDAPERDELEEKLLQFCIENNVPILGICRGMQFLVSYFGGELMAVKGQVMNKQNVIYLGVEHEVNSYHNLAIKKLPDCFTVSAWDKDQQMIKSVSHKVKNIMGIMWHPERMIPFDKFNKSLIRSFFL